MGLEPRLSLASLEFESLPLCPSFVLRSQPVLPLPEDHPHRRGSPALMQGGAGRGAAQLMLMLRMLLSVRVECVEQRALFRFRQPRAEEPGLLS